MRFAFIADIPDWALHRQGLGLVKYGTVGAHSWELLHVRPLSFSAMDLYEYDAVRLGASGVLYHAHTNGWLPVKATAPKAPPRIVCSLASFRDEPAYRQVLEYRLPDLDAFCTVDHRLLAQCGAYRRAAVHVPDRTDPETFFPQPDLRPTEGPLRIGWAGSVAYWPGVKHPDRIEKACKLVRGVQFVQQDREKDGQKNAREMALWFNSLDAYCVANEANTPTPVPWLEAAACGVPILGTRCGELWQLAQAIAPEAVIPDPSVEEIVKTLQRAVRTGREKLHARGLMFQKRFPYFLYWDRGIAKEFTRFVVALCARQLSEASP